MSWFIKTIIIVAVNAVIFWGLARWLTGFNLTGEIGQTFIIAVLFTILNLVLKPILKLILGPIIILTLGLGLVLVNVLTLYILDMIVKNLTIDGALPLIYASLILGAVNFGLHLIFKNK